MTTLEDRVERLERRLASLESHLNEILEAVAAEWKALPLRFRRSAARALVAARRDPVVTESRITGERSVLPLRLDGDGPGSADSR